ncbi:MAG: type VI secretion system baseplate subunit TssE [Rhodospirillales bacterium]|nr:type VI secretion system baseplate subunit TssE [Rhodospirillales bacterium]
MAGPRPITGVPTPLFDRMMNDKGCDGEDHGAPSRILDRPSLLASVARELERLLGTRASVDAATLARRHPRSTLDYGIPDLSFFQLAGPDGAATMARHIVAAIAAYEPRLKRPRVTIEPSVDRRDGAVARIEGSLAMGSVIEPVVFRVALGVSSISGAIDDE